MFIDKNMNCSAHKQDVLTVQAPKFQDNCNQRCFWQLQSLVAHLTLCSVRI